MGHGGSLAVYSWNNLNKVHHVNSSGTGSSSSSGGFKRPKSNLLGKEGAKDVPDWAKGNKPKINENGDKFARRLLDEKYGKGNYQTGPTSEFSKIKKWGDRAFE
ncbi:MAG: hypothetical protein ACKO96_11695 [Flammeovirgaceae bacterium]